MTSIPDITTLFWIGTSENIDVGIRHGFTTADAVEAAIKEWKEFIAQLDSEWSSDRIKEWVIAYHASRHKTIVEFIDKMEIKNRDDRVKGVSFKDRQVLSQKITLGLKIAGDIKKDAEECKKKSYNVHQFVEPVDMPLVKENGFESLLKRWYW